MIEKARRGGTPKLRDFGKMVGVRFEAGDDARLRAICEALRGKLSVAEIVRTLVGLALPSVERDPTLLLQPAAGVKAKSA